LQKSRISRADLEEKLVFVGRTDLKQKTSTRSKTMFEVAAVLSWVMIWTRTPVVEVHWVLRQYERGVSAEGLRLGYLVQDCHEH
jgi:hypothetical protein